MSKEDRDPAVETTAMLVNRIRSGDRAAQDDLVQRYLRPLSRWAHGRLPTYARRDVNTEDIVQDTMLRALRRVNDFEARETGSFLAYLRQILKNRIRDEIRKVGKIPGHDEIDDDLPESAPDPFEEAVGTEVLERYEAALEQLPTKQREGVIMRVELRFSHQQVADALGMSSPGAARMMVARAIERVAELMA
jgi:RNA polymerase sigma-70 factor (ECF subfamily)